MTGFRVSLSEWDGILSIQVDSVALKTSDVVQYLGLSVAYAMRTQRVISFTMKNIADVHVWARTGFFSVETRQVAFESLCVPPVDPVRFMLSR